MRIPAFPTRCPMSFIISGKSPCFGTVLLEDTCCWRRPWRIRGQEPIPIAIGYPPHVRPRPACDGSFIVTKKKNIYIYIHIFCEKRRLFTMRSVDWSRPVSPRPRKSTRRGDHLLITIASRNNNSVMGLGYYLAILFSSWTRMFFYIVNENVILFAHRDIFYMRLMLF